MQSSREARKQKLQPKGCKAALCCSCRFSVSSSEEAESSNSDRYPTISSLAHAMVQERLDQMIREREEIINEERRMRMRRRTTTTTTRDEGAKFIVMVAMEKSSYDPRQDFRESIEQMIRTNRIYEPRNLRRLLDYYVSMNSEEHQSVILEVFYEVCTNLFLTCNQNSYGSTYSSYR